MQPDVEIFDKNDDVLNRNEFSNLLAKSIMDYNHEDPLTIGIMGSWGSGKSSLINLVENNLKKEKFIIIRFNPWFFSNQDNLYLQFFKLIISELKTKDIETQNIFERKIKPKRKIFKKSDDYLKEYFNYIKDSSLEFNIDNLYYSDHLESYDSLQFHKKQCEKYFSELGSKIIVIIDDIDRLMDTEIIQIFTLVKSLADFKHFIYILSFDKLIVTEALNGNSSYKDNFIDKIIQIPINVPHISESKMDELIDLNIGSIYKEQLGKNFKDYNNNFNQIFEYLKLFIKDIRDLKRYMNLLNFYKDNFSDELNINDFYLILAIQLFEYQLYVKIKNSQEIITMDYYFNVHCLVEEEREYNEFKQFINNSYNKYLSLLNFLFPILDMENISLSSDLYDSYYNEHRICIDNYFEKYFTLSLENNEASDIMVNELIKINDIDKICEIFKRRNNLEYNHSLVSKFSKSISEIPKENHEVFFKSIMKCGDEINLYISTRKYIVQILNDLYAEIESEDSRLRLLEECIDYPNNVLTLSEFVHSLKNNKLFNDKNNLNKVTKSTIDKIRKCSDDNNFLNMEFLQNMLFYWKQLDDENYVKRYVLDNVISDEEVISFLSKFRTKAESPFYIIGAGSNAHLVLDLDELNTYHGLEFYEK